MQVAPEITFRGIERSETLVAEVQAQVEGLEQYCQRITSCHVTIALPHHHQRQGRLFEVRIVIAVPERELVVSRHPEEQQAHVDAHVAIRDAFRAMRRILEDYVREMRGDVKSHAAVPTGRVSELFPLEDYGFITTTEGRRVYFHRNAVLDDRFDELDLESEVRFAEEMGDKGPQATTVRLTGR